MHRDRRYTHAIECIEIGREHFLIGHTRVGLGQVETISILHQEFASTHDPKTRTDLVPELPLLVIKIDRQLFVALHKRAEDVRNHLFIGGAVKHVALVTVGDAQHFLAIVIIAPGLAPQIGLLQGRHQHFDGTRAIHLLSDDLLDLFQDPEAKWQPGINAGAVLANHAGPQHQFVARDGCVSGHIFGDGNEESGEAHRRIFLFGLKLFLLLCRTAVLG